MVASLDTPRLLDTLRRAVIPEPINPYDVVPDLYEDLVVRQHQAVYNKGKFAGFGFDLAVRAAEGAEPSVRAKFVKLLRVVRVPPMGVQRTDEATALVDLHRNVLVGLRQNGVLPLTVVANDPHRHGLLYLVGVQAIAPTRQIAAELAEQALEVTGDVLRAEYRQIGVRALDEDEALWLSHRLMAWDKVAVFRGIPQPRREAGTSLTLPLAGVMPESTVEEQIEAFCRGMSLREYMMFFIANPLSEDAILRVWRKISRHLEAVESDVEKTRTYSAGVSMPFGFLGNMGGSQGATHSTSLSHGVSASHSQADTTGSSVGTSHTVGASTSHSVSTTHSVGHTTGESQGIGQTQGVSQGASLTHGASVGQSAGLSHSASVGHSQSVGASQSQSHGTSASVSTGTTASHTDSSSTSVSTSHSSSQSTSQSVSHSTSNSESTSSGWNTGSSASFGANHSTSQSAGTSKSSSVGESSSYSTGTSASMNGGINLDIVKFGGTTGVTHTQTTGISSGHSIGVSHSHGTSSGTSEGIGSSSGYSGGASQGSTQSSGQSFGSSSSVGTSQSVGTTQGVSNSVGSSHSQSQGVSTSATVGSTRSTGVSTTQGTSLSQGTSQGVSASSAASVGQSAGSSRSAGVSAGTSTSHSVSSATTVGQSVSNGTSTSQSASQSLGQTTGSSAGTGSSTGDSLGSSWGWGGSMAIAPSMSVSFAKKIYDEHLRNLANILATQRSRFTLARQEGAWQTYTYLLTPDDKTKEAAVATATSSFWGPANKGDLPTKFHALLDVSPLEEHHLLEHVRTMSSCMVAEPSDMTPEAYHYSTVLTTSEFAVLSHPPRIDLPGLQYQFEAIPPFRVPNDADDTLRLGRLVNSEVGEPSEFRFGFSEKTPAHFLVCGATRSGKTVSCEQLVSRWVNQPPKKVYAPGPDGGPVEEYRHYGAVVLDWKRTWRGLYHHVDPARFSFVSLWDSRMGFRYNLLAVPKAVPVSLHMNRFAETLALSFSLGLRGKGILREALQALYEKRRPLRWIDPSAGPTEAANVFDRPEMSRFCGMVELHDEIVRMLTEAQGARNVGNSRRDGIEVVRGRLQYFASGEEMAKIFTRDTTPDEIGSDPEVRERHERGELLLDRCTTLEDLVADQRVVVMEGGALDPVAKKAIITSLATALFSHAQCIGDRAFDPPLMVVLEEAHEVLVGGDSSDAEIAGGGETIWEIMWNEGASYGLRLVSICQMPDRMPTSVLANSGAVICHRIETGKAQEQMMMKLGRDWKTDHRPLRRFLGNLPVGWAVVRRPPSRRYSDADICLVEADMLEHDPPSDDALRRLAASPLELDSPV